MALDKTRLGSIAAMQLENVQDLFAKIGDPAKDASGTVSGTMELALSFIGIADFVVHNDVAMFKQRLTESASLKRSMLERFNAGQPIDRSYVSMLAHKSLFTALAVGDQALASELAALMGGREALEREFDHPFDLALGYTLKAFVQKDRELAGIWLPKFSEICQKRENVNFRGYVRVFEGIDKGDLATAQTGLDELAATHRAECKGSGIFRDSPDELLCVWGIAVANLARFNGLNVESTSSLIPDVLLVEGDSCA
jgi:hypothetical protein